MFFTGFLKHPVMVGSIIPSSDKLIAKMHGPVDWANCTVFVEYGPGVGTFSRAILDRLPADGQYIAIDTNPDFVAYLRHTIVDPRFSAIHASAENVGGIVRDHGARHADYVLSGLPFSTRPDGVGPAIACTAGGAAAPRLPYSNRPRMKSANAAPPPIQPLIPAVRKMPHVRFAATNPAIPNRIIARRPLWSDRLAQIGAAITHSKADTEKAAATALSFTSSDRPSAGRTDCSAVFPAAIVNMTRNSSANWGSMRVHRCVAELGSSRITNA